MAFFENFFATATTGVVYFLDNPDPLLVYRRSFRAADLSKKKRGLHGITHKSFADCFFSQMSISALLALVFGCSSGAVFSTRNSWAECRFFILLFENFMYVGRYLVLTNGPKVFHCHIMYVPWWTRTRTQLLHSVQTFRNTIQLI